MLRKAARASARTARPITLGQGRLDEQTGRAVRVSGGSNFLQAEYTKEVALVAMENRRGLIEYLYPEANIMNSEAWTKAFMLAVGFLRRYKMNQTIATIRAEFRDTPRSSVYSRGSEIDQVFKGLLEVSRALKDFSFEERVARFEEKVRRDIPGAVTKSRHVAHK
jgi:hypothetical protein